VTPKTRRLMATAVTAVMVLAIASPAWAQRGRKGRQARTRSVVVVGDVYGPSYGPWWMDTYSYGQYPYPYRPYPRSVRYDDASALRIEVQPRDAEVYLDTYLVGTVDDFDGFFQRLRVPAGEHEVEIYREGFRSFNQKIYLVHGRTFNIRHTMEPLASGDAPTMRPVTRPLPPPALPVMQPPLGEEDRGRRPSFSPARSTFGSIAVRVQPEDAEVVIDDETWTQGIPGEQLVVQVAAGRPRVEIQKPGLRTFSQDVDVPPGETVTLNVSLRSEYAQGL
jgi:hypothetical protein